MSGSRLRAALVTALILGLGGAASSGAAGLPPPSFASSVDIGLVSGTVLVTPAHGITFRLGAQDRHIPIGSEIDTRAGEVDLRTAYAPGSGHTGVQDGQFSGGRFTILQRRDQHGLGVLELIRPANADELCAARVSSRVLSLLRATAHGAFRTRGRYSAATVRGTAWTTIDRCDGTLTQVQRGVVTVLDLVRHRTITLRAGQSYLARSP